MEKVSDMEIGLFTIYMRNRGMRESTVQIYTSIIKRFLSTRPDVYKLEDYNDFLIKYAVKKSHYNYPYALMKFLDYYFEDAKIRNEIIRGLIVRPLKDRKKSSAKLTPELIKKVISHLTVDKYKLIAKIQFKTGVRVNDIILGMTKKNLHLEYEDGKKILRILLQMKGGRMINTFLIDEELIDELITYSNRHSKQIILPEENINDEFVFLEPPCKNATPERINSFYLAINIYRGYWFNLKKALTANNIPMKDWSTHDFRRNFARITYKASGNDFEKLKQAMNHVRAETTLKYIKSDAIEIKDLIKKVQGQITETIPTKKLIVIKDNYIEGFNIGDEISPNIINDIESRDFIKQGLNDKAFKYI